MLGRGEGWQKGKAEIFILPQAAKWDALHLPKWAVILGKLLARPRYPLLLEVLGWDTILKEHPGDISVVLMTQGADQGRPVSVCSHLEFRAVKTTFVVK